MMKNIVVALDGSDNAKRALDMAASLAGKFDGRLTIVHVAGTKPLSNEERQMADVEFADRIGKHVKTLNPEAIQGFKEAGLRGFLSRRADEDAVVKKVLGEAILEAAGNSAKAQGANEVETVLEDGEAASKIVEVAKDRGADLIVVGCRGLSELGELVHGSVSHKVNHMAPSNVMTVK